MKRLSLKWKITLWYTLVMIVISATALFFMTSMSKAIIYRDISGRIARTVNDFSRRISAPDSKIENIPEFGFYEQGVHMTVYDSEGNMIAGKSPFEITDSAEFKDNTVDTVTERGNKFYIYTKEVHRPGKTSLWVKGTVSVRDESFAVQSAAKTNIVLTIVLIIIAAGGGYMIIKKALEPVNKISRTAKSISESRDLSRRINIGSGKDEIHDLANVFDEMLDKIEQTVEREKQFTSDASHELRTPVAVILSECEYMTDCAKTYDEMFESAVSVKGQAEKMSKLISELLTISRMDKNTIKANIEEVDVSELLGFVCDEQEEINTKDITLSRNIEPGIIANADRFLLARLCINLISNAYSYGKSEIVVSLSKNGDKLKLSVKDDGIGISDEHKDKIWERFYQVDPSRSDNTNGSCGLGLSMVKWIAQCHGGNVGVESEPGAGSVFTFVMPLEK